MMNSGTLQVSLKEEKYKMTEEKTYEEGLRDGAINAVEATQGKHEMRLNSHSMRLAKIERFMYISIGALIILQAFPLIQQVLTSLK